MGFESVTINYNLLKKYAYDIRQCCDILVDERQLREDFGARFEDF